MCRPPVRELFLTKVLGVEPAHACQEEKFRAQNARNGAEMDPKLRSYGHVALFLRHWCSLEVVDCNGRSVTVFADGQLLSELSGKHIPRRSQTESETWLDAL